MKTLVLGDVHLDTLYPGYLESQLTAISKLVELEDPNRIIFLGDVFNRRKPSPEVLLGFKTFLTSFSWIDIDIIRGNHDSSTKADDGITALSLFEMLKNVTVHTQFTVDYALGFTFLPHYEDTKRIKKHLECVNRSHILFGHFGYTGFRNSFGDCDSDIKIVDFNSKAILGHIHEFHRESEVTLLGTPYQTQFSEHRNSNYYAVIDTFNNIEYKVANVGPKFHQIDLRNLNEYKFDRNRFNLVRVLVNKFDDSETVNLKENLLKNNPIEFLEVKYYPSFEEEEDLSNFESDSTFTEIDSELIASYIAEAKTDISSEELLKGLEVLKDAIK